MSIEFSKIPGTFVGQAREQITKPHTQYKFSASSGSPDLLEDEDVLARLKEDRHFGENFRAEYYEFTMRLRKYLEEVAPDKRIEISPLTFKIIDQ